MHNIGENMQSNKILRNQLGMTLMEIMIVLIIVGGLMAVLGTKVMDNFQKTRIKQVAAQFGELSNALNLYYADCNDYPPTETGLEGLLRQDGTNCESWGPEAYANPKMLRDPWGTPIQYENLGGKFLLRSLGKDKKEGGDGANRDITNEEAEK